MRKRSMHPRHEDTPPGGSQTEPPLQSVPRKGLASDPGVRVAGERGVEDTIGDLVSDLGRVSLGDRLGGEQ